MKHCSITFYPEGKTITVHQGAVLLEAAGQAGIILNSPCGGAGLCGKCRVLIGPEKQEVLACQYRISSDLDVFIPPESRYFQQQILEHGIEREMHIAPTVFKKFLSSAPSTFEILKSALFPSLGESSEVMHPDGVFDPEILSHSNGITAVLAVYKGSCRILCIEPEDTQHALYGIAADIGTTTLVLRLVDLLTGEVRRTASTANPQIRYGDDVIGRIQHGQTEKGLSELQRCVIQRLNELITDLCVKEGISAESIYEITAVGNTTMHHLLLKYPVAQLGQAPYRAYSTAAEDRNARQAGFSIHPQGRLYTVENIAGFVGSDTVAASLAAGMDTAKEVSLLVDIGTNGELVLGTGDRLVSASCAAGPALEGARILYGSRAEEGAIQRVFTDGEDIDVDVIGSIPPRTLCGSGLIDAAAVLLDLGVLTATGAFCERDILEEKLSPSLLDRIMAYQNQPAFVLAWKEGTRQPAVILTQKDVREVQLAKAAIQAGIDLLLKKMNLTADQIQHLFLAGAFGNYIQKQSAIRIGLLPAIGEEKIQFIGNAACVGAQMVLMSRRCREDASKLAGRIQYVEIARESDFQAVYSESMLF